MYIGYKRVRRGIHMGCNSCFLELYSKDLILATIVQGGQGSGGSRVFLLAQRDLAIY